MSYYSRSATSNAIQQRGETAVLGVASPIVQASPSSSSKPFEVATPPRASTSSIVTTLQQQQRIRGIGRRKLQRRENAQLASNPHVVRPSPRDYALRHNERTPNFPLPLDLQKIFAAKQGNNRSEGETTSNSLLQGGLTMTYSDAHWFLTHRVGIRPREDPLDASPIQHFAKQAERHLAHWLKQDLFMYPNRTQGVTLIATPDEDPSLHLVEISRSAHNLVWSVEDAFRRLILHCLARVFGCASFSKNDANGKRCTWILKSRLQQQQQQRGGEHRSLDTPPTTDVGSELATSDAASSHAGMDDESEWAFSDDGEVTAAAVESAGDETLHSSDRIEERNVKHSNVDTNADLDRDSDPGEWADVE